MLIYIYDILKLGIGLEWYIVFCINMYYIVLFCYDFWNIIIFLFFIIKFIFMILIGLVLFFFYKILIFINNIWLMCIGEMEIVVSFFEGERIREVVYWFF